MTAGALERVREIFEEALEAPPSERNAVVAQACGGDGSLEERVLALLAAHSALDEDSFLLPPRPDSLSERIRSIEETIPPQRRDEVRRQRLSVLSGRILSSRYRLRHVLGRGAFSSVFLAKDLLSGGDVAVKLLDGLSGEELALVRREVAILRLLRLPGVVQLLDEGEEEGIPFIVMERVEGTPFGREVGSDWESLGPSVLALLETLSRIHWAGVIHRDLKPANVLVDEGGRPIVLDLGTATEQRVRTRLGGEGELTGTPLYIAPEQLRGEPATVRSDLYAVGVMLYRCFAGRPPQTADTLPGLIHERLSEAPPLLGKLAAELPGRVAEVVDRLLAIRPEDRPASCAEVIGLLKGEGESAHRIPRLGGREALRRLLLAAEENESVDLHGSPGSGRTRCLSALARVLRSEQGRRVFFLVPGSDPFSSLGRMFGDLKDLGETSLEEVREEIDGRVSRALEQGHVLLADDPERLDEWTREGLERWRSRGFVVRAVGEEGRGPGQIHLAPLRERDLTRLFHGSDRLFHIPRDAAGELFRRTGGLPGRIAEEVESWVRAGLARWEGDRLAVSRTSLDRLRTGLRVKPPPPHMSPLAGRPSGEVDAVLGLLVLAGFPLDGETVARTMEIPAWRVTAAFEQLLRQGAVRGTGRGLVEALAPSGALSEWSEDRRRRLLLRLVRELPPGREGRLRLLIATGQLERVPEEALATARRLSREGHVGEARVALQEGLIASREALDPQVESELLRVLVEFSLLEGRAAALDEALYWLARSADSREEVLVLETIARAAMLALRGDGARALELLGTLEEVRTNLETERLRTSVAVFAARFVDLLTERRVVGEAVARAESVDAPRFRASAKEWLGWLRYREGAFAEAARLHRESAALAVDRPARLSTLLNAASAFLEAGRYEEAAEQARLAREMAAACRHPLHEARAEWIARAVTYRSGEDPPPDVDLIEATRSLGSPNLEAMILLNEAAAAWRTGDPVLAAELAGEASGIWTRMGQSAGRLLADSLRLLAGGDVGCSPAELLDSAKECPVPGIAIQALGLLARSAPDCAKECLVAAEDAARTIPEETWADRREVISIAEALAAGSETKTTEERGR